MIRSIGASIGVTVCFFYLGCGSIQVASALSGLNNAPLTIATKLLPSAIAGTPYVAVLDATGGTPGYTWGIAAGKLPSGISLTPTTGIISGTPTASGTSSIGLTLSDASNPTQKRTATVTVTVAPSTLAIVASALPSATDGTAYSQALRATGGTPSYTWSISSGKLPAGLTLGSSTGVISGTPTAISTSNFGVTVRDNERPAQTQSLAMSISAAANPTSLKITPSALPSVSVGIAYSQGLHATGGTAPYIWSVTSGSLPAGLALTTSTGAISGTPTASGTSTFIATVTDSSSRAQSASATMAVVVTPTHLAITPSDLPSVRVGSAYSQVLLASGGTTPYRWSIASGKLPVGLNLTQATGMISGTPTLSETATFTAAVTDSGSPTQSATSASAVVVTANPLVITSSALPAVTAGAAYSQTLQASGGTLPYAWSITSGKLPSGLTLALSTGTISGTPTTSGPFSFTTTVTDSSNPAQTASATAEVVVVSTSLTIVTSALPPISVGAGYSQVLTATGGAAPYSWSITSGQLPGGLSLLSSGAISGTATSSAGSSFTVTVRDSSVPAQIYAAGMTIGGTSGGTSVPLTIVSSSLLSGTDGTPYSQILQASGGTPAYTWSITSGSLPAGLTLAATTGAISGTPTSTGTSSFTATVTDNGSPAQTQSAATSIAVAATTVAAGPGTTWYIRTDGGTRYSANVPTGQCDGQADVAYPGSGANQHCAFNDVRYMWDDGTIGNWGWVISGGDTVVVEGCAASAGQQNPSSPNCRIGWDNNLNNSTANPWCWYAPGNYGSNLGCYNPTIPAGTSGAHTRILGLCAYNNNCTPVKTYPYTGNNLTQLFGGFGNQGVLNLTGTQYVDVEGLEITTHNGKCIQYGSPAYPKTCSNSIPNADDYANNGILTDDTTANILLQDVYVHGFTAAGMFGPIGGAIAMTRVSVDFNGFAGWNFADSSNTPDAAGSSIAASYVTMEGNGCDEQYPIVNGQFPAFACYDSNSGGFGDSWSGQDTPLASFSCDHCQQIYNTKDGWIGPHTITTTLSITNSVSIGNMGQQWKWTIGTNSTALFQNNLTVGNCDRMTQQLPGAAQNFGSGSGLPGSNLSNFCRAAGDMFSLNAGANSTTNIVNNTEVGYNPTIFDLHCITVGTCATAPYIFTNNITLGYTAPNGYGGWGNTEAPGLYYLSDASNVVQASHNIEYGIRNGDTCGGNILCSDPQLVNEPAQGTIPPESVLDNFNFSPISTSPAIGVGITMPGLTTDYNGSTRANPPSIGAVER
jgi:Putative Ig domain